MKRSDLFKQSTAFYLSSGFLVVMITAAFIVPLMTDLEPFIKNGPSYLAPCKEYLLGTNGLGQDCLARLIFGLRSSLIVGLTAAAIATLLGTAIGIGGGFTGGIVDSLCMSATNLLVIVPQLIVLILISNSIQNASLPLLSLFIGLSSWVWIARALQAQTSSLRLRDHVALARLNGSGTASLLVKQILPYVASYVCMAFIIQLGSAIFSEAALSMLGLGPRGSEVVSLGSILDDARLNEAFESGYWWVFLPPTLTITLCMFSLFSLNTSLEKLFNPRLRKNN